MSGFEVMNPFEHHWAVVIECRVESIRMGVTLILTPIIATAYRHDIVESR